MKFAAIDVGSNAVRLLFANVFEKNGEIVCKKSELIRIPLRLGEDAFLQGKISEAKTVGLIKAITAFKLLIDMQNVTAYRACATSAMRDASNGSLVIERVKQETGIKLEIIDGKTEAAIVYSNHVAEEMDKNSSYLYIDVGGGSTEVTLFSKDHSIASRSFNIGTIRMLHKQVDKEYWSMFKQWIAETTKGYQPIIAIGSGGNINKLFKMSKKKEHKPLAFAKIKAMYELLCSYTLEERIQIMGLNPDRADVIVPATKIYLTIMKMAGIEKIVVPQIGLSDGIVHLLYEEHNKKEERNKSVGSGK